LCDLTPIKQDKTLYQKKLFVTKNLTKTRYICFQLFPQVSHINARISYCVTSFVEIRT